MSARSCQVKHSFWKGNSCFEYFTEILLILAWEPSETLKMELFMKTAYDFQPITVFAKGWILDVWPCSV